MPAAVPIAEFARNQAEVIAELERTGEPLYLTRNGRSSLVVMSAEAFDRKMAHEERERKLEEEVYSGILEGLADQAKGRVSDLSEADARIRAAKGW